MMSAEIESTEWAKRFKEECPTSYREAVAIAARIADEKNFVVIEKRDDHSGKNDFLWAVIPECNTEFWLEALPTKKASLAVCRQMQWRVRR